jgi:hypothetical protein
MIDRITIDGKIKFEPIDRTNKHREQASWKRIAMVIFDGDVTEYYSWFIKKRFNLELNKPIRGTHISFINDSVRDLSKNGVLSGEKVNKLWDDVKNKWDGLLVPITLGLTPKISKQYWCLTLSEESKNDLQGIRAELGLGKPFFDLHMTIGRAEHRHFEHSQYIHSLIKQGLIS